MKDWQYQDGGIEASTLAQDGPPAAPFEEPGYALATPGIRWFARLFDLWWQTLLIGFLASYILSQNSPAFLRWTDSPGGNKIFTLLCIPVAPLLDAVLQANDGVLGLPMIVIGTSVTSPMVSKSSSGSYGRSGYSVGAVDMPM